MTVWVDAYTLVAADLRDRAHGMRVEASGLAPRHKDRLRSRAARLERAARLLVELAEEDERTD